MISLQWCSGWKCCSWSSPETSSDFFQSTLSAFFAPCPRRSHSSAKNYRSIRHLSLHPRSYPWKIFRHFKSGKKLVSAVKEDHFSNSFFKGLDPMLSFVKHEKLFFDSLFDPLENFRFNFVPKFLMGLHLLLRWFSFLDLVGLIWGFLLLHLFDQTFIFLFGDVLVLTLWFLDLLGDSSWC